MYQVQSSIVLKSELENVLRSTWAAHNGLAGALPVREVQIYRAGFEAALQAVGLAVGVDWEDAPAPPPTPNRRTIFELPRDGRGWEDWETSKGE